MEKETEQFPAEEAGIGDFGEYISLLSGKNEEGMANATVSYQCYCLEDPEDSPAKKVAYPLTTPWVQMWVDKMNSGFVGVDIAFRSFDDTELRLLWGRMGRHLQNMSKHPDKTWVLYFNILSNEGLKRGRERITMAHVVNPAIFFLTRQGPTEEAENMANPVSKDYGPTGGSIVRMLVPIELVTVEVADGEAYGLERVRAEVQRELDEVEFVNATAQSDAWNEDCVDM